MEKERTSYATAAWVTTNAENAGNDVDEDPGVLSEWLAHESADGVLIPMFSQAAEDKFTAAHFEDWQCAAS